MGDEKRIIGRLMQSCCTPSIDITLEMIPKAIAHIDAELERKENKRNHSYSLVLSKLYRDWELAEQYFNTGRQGFGPASNILNRIYRRLYKISVRNNIILQDISDMPLVSHNDEEPKQA